MLRVLATILVLLVPETLAAQPPNWQVFVNEDESVSIIPALEGFASAEKALESLSDDRDLRGMRLDPKILFGEMQGEIYQFLQSHHPKKLAEAMSSAGNLHNPKVKALAGGFLEAVLATAYVTELNELLGRFCHKVEKVVHEKFSMSNRRDPPSFAAVVWLELEKTACEPTPSVSVGVATICQELLYADRREQIPQVLRVWLRYRSEKHFGDLRTPPGKR